MMPTATSEAIARAAISKKNAARLDKVKHGTVTAIIQDGKVLRFEVREQWINEEPQATAR